MAEPVNIATLFRGKKGHYLSQPGSIRDNVSLTILGPHSLVQQQKMGGPVQKYESGALEAGGVG